MCSQCIEDIVRLSLSGWTVVFKEIHAANLKTITGIYLFDVLSDDSIAEVKYDTSCVKMNYLKDLKSESYPGMLQMH